MNVEQPNSNINRSHAGLFVPVIIPGTPVTVGIASSIQNETYGNTSSDSAEEYTDLGAQNITNMHNVNSMQ